ncbi:MAG: nuclear transport factor 2 family protein [Psychromonas sp.]|nr:nuclear transport factor 2 family protein [Psychromonas sp.]
MSDAIIDSFCDIYQQLNKDNIGELTNIYSEDVIFIDAAHQLQGINELSLYFHKLYQNINYCQFHIEQVIAKPRQASIIWTMNFAHKQLNSGQNITVNGCSHLKFDQKIYYHRDYLDMGQMIYEHLPLFGRMIKFIKQRVSQ